MSTAICMQGCHVFAVGQPPDATACLAAIQEGHGCVPSAQHAGSGSIFAPALLPYVPGHSDHIAFPYTQSAKGCLGHYSLGLQL